ncbi:phosphopantetheine-binding protein [Streptomyces sp. NPDC054956]
MSQSAPAPAPAPAPALAEAVLGIVRTKFEAPEGTTAQTAYEEMEFDSLVLLELAVHLSNVFRIDVTDDEILKTGNVEETAGLLAAKGARV